jgi:hypothetical protein
MKVRALAVDVLTHHGGVVNSEAFKTKVLEVSPEETAITDDEYEDFMTQLQTRECAELQDSTDGEVVRFAPLTVRP